MIELDRRGAVPLYIQIRDRLRQMIVSGALAEGTNLPPERSLAARLGVTRGTVTSAYRELVAEGLAEARVGRGTTVRQSREELSFDLQPPSPLWSALFAAQPEGSRDALVHEMARLASQPDAIALTAGVPARELYPAADFHAMVVEVLRRRDADVLGPCAAEGHRSLRQALAQHMIREGTEAVWEQVLVTTGAQQGLDLLARAFLRPGDSVIVEEPTYLGALQSFIAAGIRLLGVPLDGRGLRLDILANLLASHHPKLIYTLPTFQNPSGISQDLERRVGLLALAARHGVPVVEDDPFRPLFYEKPPPPTMKALDQCRSVIYLGTFSKMLFPGLRLGWIAAPRPVIEQLVRIKQRVDLYGNVLAQCAAAAFLEAGCLEKHLVSVRGAYRRRRDAMVAALAEHCPDLTFNIPAGGFNLWCQLPLNLESRDFLTEAGLRGVVFAPGELFYAGSGGENALRLNFSAQSEKQIWEAIARLGQALAALQSSSGERLEPERLAELLV